LQPESAWVKEVGGGTGPQEEENSSTKKASFQQKGGSKEGGKNPKKTPEQKRLKKRPRRIEEGGPERFSDSIRYGQKEKRFGKGDGLKKRRPQRGNERNMLKRKKSEGDKRGKGAT